MATEMQTSESPVPVLERRFLTTSDIARILNTHRTTVHRMIASGTLAAIDITPEGSNCPRYRISADVLEAFLNEREEAGA